MIVKTFSSLKWFSYPIRKYYSTCIAFTLVAFFISSVAFFIGFSDDRGLNLKNYLSDPYIVGDFSSYDKSFSEIFAYIINFVKSNDFKSTDMAFGPIVPLFIWISKSISNNFIPYYIFSIYLSYWFIALSIDLSKSFLPWFESQFSDKKISINFFKKFSIKLSNVEIFGIIFNPILIYYVIFPATDLPFACCILAIIKSFKEDKFLYSYLFYIISTLTRPTGLFLFPSLVFIFYFELKKRKKNRILIHIFLTSITLVFFRYYHGYAELNFQDSLTFGDNGEGLSVWGLPVPGWVLFKEGNITLLINKLASIIFTPFIQLISILGIRPSFTTIFGGDISNAFSIVSVKPYLYAYVRIIWGAAITLPGFLLLFLNYLKLKKTDLLIFLIIIFSFAIGLSSSIPLERYLFYAFPILSLVSISSYLKFMNDSEY